MTHAVRAISKIGTALNPLSRVKSSNTLREIIDPGGIAGQRIAEGAPLNARTVLDPGNWLHSQKPDVSQIGEPPPAPSIQDAGQAEGNAYVDTSRLRRRRGILANMFGFGASLGSNVGRQTLG